MPGSVLTPVERSTVVDRLTVSLIDAAVTGRLVVGEPLPPERELAQELEVNRATLRQAVARLEQIGLLTRRQGSGTVVRDPRQLTAPEVVARVAATDHVAFLADLVEVRQALAGVIGRRARGAVTAAQIDRLRGHIAAIEDVTATARERQVLELAFFAVLVEAAGNRAIAVLLHWVEDVYGRLAHGSVARQLPSIEPAFEDGGEIAAQLRLLLEVVESDGDLAEAVAAYAERTGERLLASVRQQPD